MVYASIIILTKNAGDRFEKLLKKLNSQTYRNFEILIVDSGSADNTLEIAKKYDCRIHEIKPQEFHHGKTRNLSAKLAKGRILIYITQDALPLSNRFLEYLISPLNEEKVAGVYGRQIAYPDAKPMDKFFYSYFYPNKRFVITPKDLKNLFEFCLSHVYISNVCSALKKKVWKKINFNSKVIVSEDKKWAIDALNAGYKIIYEPKASVYHSHSYSLTSAFKRRFDEGVALKQICKNSGKTISKGLSFFTSELKYLWKNYKFWIPYALIYNFLMFAGFGFGIRHKFIPNILKKYFSNYPHLMKGVA